MTAAPKLTQSVDRQAPKTPGGVGVSAVSSTTITLAWSASRDNVGVAGYGVYLNNVRVASTSARSYRFTGLTCGTTYRLGVDAFDAQRNRSGIAAVLAATAPCVDASAPSAPSDLHQSSRSATGAGVAWTDSTDNVAVAGYTVYRDGVPIASTQQAAAWVDDLVCSSSHSISVDAYDAAGNRSARSTAIVSTSTCADTSPPSAPRDLVVSGATDSAFSVTWAPSVDDSGVAEYRVSLNDVVARTTTSTTASFTGLACGHSYAVDIVAADAAGNLSSRARVAASTAVCPASLQDTQPPTTPSTLVRRDGTASSITLSWTASTDNVGVAGYGIYQDGNRVDASSVTAFELQGLACGTSYTLSVDAVDVNGLRSSRATVVAATEPCPSTSGLSAPSGIAAQNRTETSITLGWQGSTGATGYRIYRDGTLLGSTSSTSYTASGLSCGKSYTFGIEAYDAAGNHSTRPATLISTTSCSDALSPSTPTSLTKTGSTATSISVSWAAGTDNVGVAGYSLFVGGNPIGTTTQTSYAFSNLTCGTSYGLAVEAYDAAGNRSQRAALSTATEACTAAPAPSAPAAGSVYVATNGSDANPCLQTRPCLTFDRAYKAAQPGGTVEIAAGSYPPQTITEDPSKGTGRVTFRPAGGARGRRSDRLRSGAVLATRPRLRHA